MLLRLQGSVVTVGTDHLVVRSPANPGFHWGNFVLADQLWVDRALADLVGIFRAEHPAAGHLAIGVDGVEGRVWDDDELGECGLEVERSVVMTATQVQEPAHPNTDAVCRMLASDADWAAVVDLQSAEHGEFDPAEHRDFVRRLMSTRRQQQEAGLGGWFGAFVDGELLCDLGLFPTVRGSDGSRASRLGRGRGGLVWFRPWCITRAWWDSAISGFGTLSWSPTLTTARSGSIGRLVLRTRRSRSSWPDRCTVPRSPGASEP